MPITLDPKTSVPQNPTAVVQLFQNIQKEYTEDKLKEIFKDKEESQKFAAEGIEKLAGLKLNPKGENVNIAQWWLEAFKEHPDEGKKLFEEIAKAGKFFAAVQAATKAEGEKAKAIDNKIVAAATNVLKEMDAALAAWGAVNTALDAAKKAEATPAAPTKGTKEALVAAMVANPTESGLLGYTSETIPKVESLDPRTLGLLKQSLLAAIYGASQGTGDRNLRKRVDPNKKAAAEKILNAAGIDPAAPETLKALREEYSLNSLTEIKKLYKLGFITENEYLASLIKIKQELLNEEVGTEAAPAGVPAANPTTELEDKLGGILADLARPEGFMQTDYYASVKKIQAEFTKEATTETLSESHRRLIKAKIKHAILTETIDENGMINELAIFAALKNILAAVAGWVSSKFSSWFKGGPATTYTVRAGSGSDPSTNAKLQTLIASIAQLQGAVQTPSGAIIDSMNKPVNKVNALKSFEDTKKILQTNQAKYQEITTEATQISAGLKVSPQPQLKDVAGKIDAAIAVKIDPNPISAALTAKENYYK